MGECHYRSGNYEVINKVNLVNKILQHLRIEPGRLSLEWVSAAEATRFVQLITEFTNRISELGPLGVCEGHDQAVLKHKLEAARKALEDRKVRMVVARQARYMKEGGTYRKLPPDHKLHGELESVLTKSMAINELLGYLQRESKPLEEVAALMNLPKGEVMGYFEELKRKNLVDPQRLIEE